MGLWGRFRRVVAPAFAAKRTALIDALVITFDRATTCGRPKLYWFDERDSRSDYVDGLVTAQ
jgi:predicted GNAT superfamily acetyltransferase